MDTNEALYNQFKVRLAQAALKYALESAYAQGYAAASDYAYEMEFGVE